MTSAAIRAQAKEPIPAILLFGRRRRLANWIVEMAPDGAASAASA